MLKKRERDEKVLLPWHVNVFELLKLPKLHLNCKYLYISLKFSTLSCFLRCLLSSWKMNFSRIMISETVLLSRSVQCWKICILKINLALCAVREQIHRMPFVCGAWYWVQWEVRTKLPNLHLIWEDKSHIQEKWLITV